MKWLCILLLVANALFVGWRVNERLFGPTVDGGSGPAVEPLPADAPPLLLLSETSEAPKSRGMEPGVAAEPVPGTTEAAETADPVVADASLPASDAEPAPISTPVTPPPPPETTVPEPTPEAAVIAEITGPNQPPAATGPSPSPAAPAELPTATTTPATAETPAMPVESPSSPTIAAQTESDESKDADEPEAPSRPVLLCATVGPFQSRDAQRAAERRLTARVERIDGRSQSSREARMFTVFLEPAGTEAEAEKRLDELKSKGITDYFLIRRGEMRNAIQVGTFRSQESVTKRMAELERSGYKAVVVPKSEAGAEKFWLDVVYDKEKQTLRSLKSLAGEGARVIRADCPR